jgi:multiple sugar transport system substrate-binding protein
MLLLSMVLALLAGCVDVPDPAAPAEPAPGSDAAPAEVPEVDPALANLSPSIPDPSEPTVVTFASWVGGGQTWQNLAEQFHELHPNITIEFQDVPFEEIRTKLLTQVAANNPPDVAYMDASAVGEFAARNALVNLDDFIAASNAVDPDDYADAFRASATVEGQMYGLPIDGESTGLFYRTD